VPPKEPVRPAGSGGLYTPEAATANGGPPRRYSAMATRSRSRRGVQGSPASTSTGPWTSSKAPSLGPSIHGVRRGPGERRPRPSPPRSRIARADRRDLPAPPGARRLAHPTRVNRKVARGSKGRADVSEVLRELLDDALAKLHAETPDQPPRSTSRSTSSPK